MPLRLLSPMLQSALPSLFRLSKCRALFVAFVLGALSASVPSVVSKN